MIFPQASTAELLGIVVVLVLATWYAIETWQGHLLKRWIMRLGYGWTRVLWGTVFAIWLAAAFDLLIGVPVVLQLAGVTLTQIEFESYALYPFLGLMLLWFVSPLDSASWLQPRWYRDWKVERAAEEHREWRSHPHRGPRWWLAAMAASVHPNALIRDLAGIVGAAVVILVFVVGAAVINAGLYQLGAALVGSYKGALALSFVVKGLAPLAAAGLIGLFVRFEISLLKYHGSTRAIVVTSLFALALVGLGAHGIADIAIDVRGPIREVDVQVMSVWTGYRAGTTLRTDHGDLGFPMGRGGRVAPGRYTLGLAAQTGEILWYLRR